MISENELQVIQELLFGVIEEVQLTQRGISINQNNLFNYLDISMIDYGFRIMSKNSIMGGCSKMDFGVNKDYYNKNYYFYVSDYNSIYFMNKSNMKFTHTLFTPTLSSDGKMSLSDVWESVESDIFIKNRNKNIDLILKE